MVVVAAAAVLDRGLRTPHGEFHASGFSCTGNISRLPHTLLSRLGNSVMMIAIANTVVVVVSGVDSKSRNTRRSE